ncbi:hypothetical protein B0H67DRAFT_558796 [Lasiosphaeris hirsuta]|uniref:Uncharacterized protein n=1 Tax=Lasiosphaeris hirsuta TaxID=260670 RepID=A0AA39ZPK3_9PEZI|nr:hypothetical protein B0H67DRAFT_558796 [Lasiosphaeris hirsuta]
MARFPSLSYPKSSLLVGTEQVAKLGHCIDLIICRVVSLSVWSAFRLADITTWGVKVRAVIISFIAYGLLVVDITPSNKEDRDIFLKFTEYLKDFTDLKMVKYNGKHRSIEIV